MRMSTEFEQQFNSEYLSCILPWALNYSCGGPDYANLFDNPDGLVDENYSSRNNASNRRPPSAPILDAGKFAQMLATRCEAQIASDWMLVPAARNLHWRYIVLHNAFCVTKRYATLDLDRGQQIQHLLDSMRWIWEAYRKNTVTINKQQCHINGNSRLLLQDDGSKVQRSKVQRPLLGVKHCARKLDTFSLVSVWSTVIQSLSW